MRTKLLSVIALLALLCSCGDPNPPVTPGANPNNPNTPPSGGSGVNNNNTQNKPTVSFDYTTAHPLWVHFENTSDHAPKYKWDFGDGQTSTERSPSHRYAGKGVYKVVLTIGDSNGHSYSYTKNITITEPTKCYFSGLVYEQVPNNNEYYNIRCTDDYVLFETLYWHTDWVLLSSANIPYTYNLKTKQQIDFSKNKYVIRLYKNNDKSGKGTQVDTHIVYPSNLKSVFFEYVYLQTDKAKIKLLLEWKD